MDTNRGKRIVNTIIIRGFNTGDREGRSDVGVKIQGLAECKVKRAVTSTDGSGKGAFR